MHTESKKAAGSLQWQAVCKFQHEDMDDHDHAEYAAIEVQRSSKEELQVPSAQWVVQFRRVLPVALEIDAQHDWDAEDELSIWGTA